MPFCYAPWTNIDITEQGKLAPCCKFRHDEHGIPALDIQNTSLEQYQNSSVVQQVKRDFENNRWPAGCVRCRIEEENNIASKRMLDRERWQTHYAQYNRKQDGYLTASIALGNTCNLTCVTCNAYSSSRWQREYKQLTGVNIKPIHFYRDNFVDEFLRECSNIKHIDFGGGEPFLTARHQHQQLLEQLIAQGRSREMTLHYTTNGTVYPEDTVWRLLDQFASVEIQFSLDGVGDRFEYIRYPAKWDQVQATVERFLNNGQPNQTLSVSHTVSAFNVRYLDEFLTWCQTVGLPKPWLGRVHEPDCLQPTVWTEQAVAAIVAHLNTSRHFDCRIWARLLQTNSHTDQFDDFCNRIRFFDQSRGTNFAKTFPELHEYVDN